MSEGKDRMKEMNFEQSMKKLEEIAKDLERDDLTLEESMKKFEEGMVISKTCKEILDTVEKKITILINEEEKEFKAE